MIETATRASPIQDKPGQGRIDWFLKAIARRTPVKSSQARNGNRKNVASGYVGVMAMQATAETSQIRIKAGIVAPRTIRRARKASGRKT